MSVFESEEFFKLQREWAKKLRASGFQDIERRLVKLRRQKAAHRWGGSALCLLRGDLLESKQ